VNNSDALSVQLGDAEPAEPAEPESGIGAPDSDLKGALHEVSNALTVVLGWLDVAGSKIVAGEVKQAIDVARTHAKLGHRIARQAIGAKVIGTNSTERLCSEFAQSALVAVQPQAMNNQVELVFSGDAERPARMRNASAALQILTNLLLNAIEFTPPKHKVTLAVRYDDDYAYFQVSDSGPGIESERAKLLFTAPASTRCGGAGIGLRHSEALARITGAQLTLVRARPSACFELCWPLSDTRSGARQSSNPPRRSLHGMRVLILEDDKDVRSLLELGLEARGAQVVAVSCSEEFTKLLARRPLLDAALLDLSPIKGDVKSAVAQVRSACPDARLVLITGQPEGVPGEAEGQFAAWVRKPFEMSEVVETLCNVTQSSPKLSPALAPR
jgi:CheY-like chemotaxis protein